MYMSARLCLRTQALCINVAEILNDYGIYAMFHELLREAGKWCDTPYTVVFRGDTRFAASLAVSRLPRKHRVSSRANVVAPL